MIARKVRRFAAMLAAGSALVGAAVPASAANIVLFDSLGGFANNGAQGQAALFAFQKAANYWNTVLTNDVTIRIEINFAALAPNVLGSTSSSSDITTVGQVYDRLAATGNSALDAIAVANLRPLDQGFLGFRANQAANLMTGTGSNPNATEFDNDFTANNFFLDVNSAVVKALGATPELGDDGAFRCGVAVGNADACITFSSQFAFDFDPTDGITAGQFDFTAVAIHELGHALGFVSGTDVYDIVAGIPALSGFNLDNFAIGSTLDLFRYGNGFDANGRQLQWAANRDAFFSIDSLTPFNFDHQAEAELANFSTGRFVGDGEQASHWKDNAAFLAPDMMCLISTRQIGIMDPTAAPCDLGVVTSNDLAAFDALGWNINLDILANRGYTFDTAQVFALDGLANLGGIPEPQTWAMMIAGFGIVGAAARRRRKVAATLA